ncbi:hypothetical protein [Corynebacterium caspium]|uniref:hypothetical protein n=1 Tax=Corynebacterium caspium TaxID=234828 RepID=UPI00036DC04F|nr:hypothetical protein [Corynebacterium caspium]WKD59734.1 hypothetical protein CCASP_06775 [Corynebacterium caspium DSM 44850]
MSTFKPARGERLLVDVTTRFSALTFPLLEAIALTGVSWIVIGWLDTSVYAGIDVHNAAVGIWAILLAWRLLWPVARARRQRLLITTHRLVHREASFSEARINIPLANIFHVQKKRRRIILHTRDGAPPLILHTLPRTKRIAAIIATYSRGRE